MVECQATDVAFAVELQPESDLPFHNQTVLSWTEPIIYLYLRFMSSVDRIFM